MATFVLVHGGFHGGWCWGPLAARLRARGAAVRTPDLSGMGADRTPPSDVSFSSWVADIAAAIDAADAPVVLVGHSLGGFVVAGAAQARSKKTAATVYLSAALPNPGESIADVAAWMAPRQLAMAAAPLEASPDNLAVRLGADADLKDIFYNLCSDADVELCRRRLSWQPLLPFAEPIRLTDGEYGRVPRIYVECLQDRAAPLDLQRELQALHGFARTYSLDADHSPFFSAIEPLAAALEEVAAIYG